jgi:uncharacterized protein HemX
MMNDPLFILIILAVLAVVVVLVLGLGGFASGKADAAKRSNKMMQLRLLFQFIAVVLIAAYVYFSRQGG